MADVGKKAVKLKPTIGKKAYDVYSVVELMKRKLEKFDITIDDDVTIKDVSTQYLYAYNSKIGGGGILINPLAMINDGYFEFCYHNGLVGFNGAIKMFKLAKNGGT